MNSARTKSPAPLVSFVLASYQRRDVLMHTLRMVRGLELEPHDVEIIVVDNASSDQTADAAETLADVVIRRRKNSGSCAKAWGVDVARGRYVVFLDDDSFPRRGSISAMLAHFEQDERLGAAGFTVHLPDGRCECSALPGVGVGCGVGFRTQALRAAGGLDRTFFMQAEEYDLSFRLVSAGWTVRVFDDLHVDHLKTPVARRSQRTTYLDIRNNLRVIARHLPAPLAAEYRADWRQRYEWLADHDGHLAAFRRGRRAGAWLAAIERWTHAGRRLSGMGVEFFFRLNELARRFQTLREQGVKRIVGADLGKNIYAFHRAAGIAGVEIAAIGDDRFAAAGRTYRGVPMVPLAEALRTPGDAVVVMNMAAAQAQETALRVLSISALPVHHWYGASPFGLLAMTTHPQKSIGAGSFPYPCEVPPLAVR